jgi:hypothetical protein
LIKLAWTYVRLGVQNELQYRANFVVAIVQSLLGVAVAIAVLALVYSKTNALNGWTRSASRGSDGRSEPATRSRSSRSCSSARCSFTASG